MKLSGILIASFLSLTLSSAFAQTENHDKAVVLFDPLFWKHDLKLSSVQCQKIRDINYEFFQEITSLSTENKRAASSKTAELLSNRSEKIWNTFQPRQKKKWKKMWSTES